MGNVYPVPGNWDIISQNNSNDAPIKMFPNISLKWLFDFITLCVMIGTATPAKAIGPQKAVVVPASKAVKIKIMYPIFLVSTPSDLA